MKDINEDIAEFLNEPVEMNPFNEFLRLPELTVEVTTRPLKFRCYLLEGKVIQ